MSFLDNIKNWARETANKAEESRRFKKAVDDETLPIRRAAYLKEKKKQAIEEGKMIAKKEFEAKKAKEQAQKNNINEFIFPINKPKGEEKKDVE